MKENFIISTVCRADLESEGYDASNVTDEQMETLARKMHDAHLDSGYWIDLRVIATEYLGIPKKI